jgi:hypothetical protein
VNLSSTLDSASPFFISESSADSYSYSYSDSTPSSSGYPNFAPFNADDSNDELADKITKLVKVIRV